VDAKVSTDLYEGGNYYIPKTAPNSPRDIIINEYYCGAIKCVFTHTHTEYYANVVDSVVFDSVYTVIENKCETV